MRIITLINIIKNTLRNSGVELLNDEIYLDEFIKGYSDEYEGLLYKNGVIEKGLKLDIGIGSIDIVGEEKSKIYVVCGNENKILYSISIGSMEKLKMCIEVMEKF